MNIIETKKIKGGRNIREVSQYKNSFNIPLRKNSLFRSARLDKIKYKRRIKFLDKYNIKTVIDLRTEVEVLEGRKLIYPDYIKYYHIPLIDQEFYGITHEKSMRKSLKNVCKNLNTNEDFENYMIDMYKSIVFDELSINNIKKVFDIIIENKDNGIIYHCTGGKDRTAIITLILLYILGVDKETIINDYNMSDIQNKRHNNILRFLIKTFLRDKKFKKLLLVMLNAKKIYLLKTIEAIEKKFGSLDSYILNVLDINNNKQDILKKSFLLKRGD